MNEAFAQLVGRPLSAFDDVRSLYDLVALDERAAFKAKVEAHVRTEQSLTIEIPIVRPDGERRFLEVALKPFGTASGARLVLIARDVTDRRYAEDALAHQALHDILTGLPNAPCCTTAGPGDPRGPPPQRDARAAGPRPRRVQGRERQLRTPHR